MKKTSDIHEVEAVKGMWVKEGDMVQVKITGTPDSDVVQAKSDPYYDNEDACDVINTDGAMGYAKWNVARGRWEC